jgi:hypothetical protein
MSAFNKIMTLPSSLFYYFPFETSINAFIAFFYPRRSFKPIKQSRMLFLS